MFAVTSIEAWWNQVGAKRYPDAREILIMADAGGSNSYRLNHTAVVAFAVCLAGCSHLGSSDTEILRIVPSTGVKTSDLKGTFKLAGVTGEAKLSAQALFSNAATGDLVDLVGDDAVYCDGARLATSAIDLPRKPSGQGYRFELRRASETVVATIVAIDEVEMLAPAASTTLHQTSPLTVTWKPITGTKIDAQLFANCAMSSAKADAELGSILLPAFKPEGVKGGPQNASNPPCDGTVSLVRTQTAVVTTTLAAMETVAEETHRVPVKVIP